MFAYSASFAAPMSNDSYHALALSSTLYRTAYLEVKSSGCCLLRPFFKVCDGPRLLLSGWISATGQPNTLRSPLTLDMSILGSGSPEAGDVCSL